ncbi:MAG: hypothetical protein AB1489_09415 [Acidobacteriota bacterium]
MRNSLPRRRRLGDPFSSPKKIEQLLESLLSVLDQQLAPYINIASVREKNYQPLVQLLQAASNFVRAQAHPPSARFTRSSRFPHSLLTDVVATMEELLEQESHGRISFRTFVDNNLRILDCPNDIKQLLEQGRITLFEALQLKRLNAKNLTITASQAIDLREELLTRCRRERWIAHRLRQEIDQQLGKIPSPAAISPPVVATFIDTSADPAVEITSPSEGSIFVEQLSLMIELLQTINADDLEGNELERLLNSIDEVLLLLQRIRRRQGAPDTKLTHNPNLGFH